MSWVAVGVGGAAVVGGALSSQGGKSAAGAAEGTAADQFGYARSSYRQTKQRVNEATTKGLAMLDRDIKNQEKNLTRQEQLISQLDPTVIEASQQALRLLRGDKASTLAPLEQQRAQQRQKLVNQLRAQLGPGAETSSAGIKALTSFDMETSGLFAGAQQQALSNLGNVSSQFSSQRPDMMREVAALSGYGQAQTDLRFRQADVLRSSMADMINARGGMGVGGVARGQQQQAMGNSILGAALSAGTAYGMSGGGASKPTAGNGLDSSGRLQSSVYAPVNLGATNRGGYDPNLA